MSIFISYKLLLMLNFRVFDDSSDWFDGENQHGRRGYFPSK